MKASERFYNGVVAREIPIASCTRCEKSIFFGDEVTFIYGEIHCEKCADEIIKHHDMDYDDIPEMEEE